VSGILLRNERIAAITTLLASGVVFPGTAIAVPVKTIEAHGGEMTDEQRREFFTKLPAVLVSCLGTSPVDYVEDQVAGGTIIPRYVMSVAVFARDEKTSTVNLHRSDVAQSIAEKIAADLFYSRTDGSTTEITRFRMDNAWLSLDDRKDVGMWVMTWEEGAALENVDPDTLPDLVTVRSEYEIADTIDAPQMIGNVTFPGQTDDPDLP
jgi:phage gp37-like protein